MYHWTPLNNSSLYTQYVWTPCHITRHHPMPHLYTLNVSGHLELRHITGHHSIPHLYTLDMSGHLETSYHWTPLNTSSVIHSVHVRLDTLRHSYHWTPLNTQAQGPHSHVLMIRGRGPKNFWPKGIFLDCEKNTGIFWGRQILKLGLFGYKNTNLCHKKCMSWIPWHLGLLFA